MQWNALNATAICSSSSAHRRFQEWEQAGVFAEIWRQELLDVLVSNAAADDVHPATIGFRQALQRPFGISRKQPHLMFRSIEESGNEPGGHVHQATPLTVGWSSSGR